MNLIQMGHFILHSGQKSRYKIDCDALSDNDWEAIAAWLAEELPPFSSVEGVPTGGLKLARSLRWHITTGVSRHLIVDDVFTTGRSMEEARAYYAPAGTDTFPRQDTIIGAVAFARAPCPAWITPWCRLPGA